MSKRCVARAVKVRDIVHRPVQTLRDSVQDFTSPGTRTTHLQLERFRNGVTWLSWAEVKVHSVFKSWCQTEDTFISMTRGTCCREIVRGRVSMWRIDLHTVTYKMMLALSVVCWLLLILQPSYADQWQNGRHVECPHKCMCYGATVRCMFQKLSRVPRVPANATVL